MSRSRSLRRPVLRSEGALPIVHEAFRSAGDSMTALAPAASRASREGGRAEVNLLWMIFGILFLFAAGFLAWDTSSRVQPAEEALATAQQDSDVLYDQLEYYTALVHHAASVLPKSAWAGSKRNPGALDISSFLLELDNSSLPVQRNSEALRNLMEQVRQAATALHTEYQREIARASSTGEESEEDSLDPTPRRDKEPEWKAADRMLDFKPLLAFNLPLPKISDYDMKSKAEQSALDATSRSAAQEATYARSYLNALVRGMQDEYDRLYRENQRLRNELFQPGSGRIAQITTARQSFEDSFTNSGSGLTKQVRDVVEVDSNTAFATSLDTVRTARGKIQSGTNDSIQATTEVYAEMAGPYLEAVSSLREAEGLLAKYQRRAEALETKIQAIVESDRSTVAAIDGRLLKVAPLRDKVYIDLNAYHHIDLGMRFEVFAVSPEQRLRGEFDKNRILLGAIEVIEVGRKGATSTARIERVDHASGNDEMWRLWTESLLVNRRYNPDYAPKVALVGSYRGFLSRETLADTLRAHNYVVQDEPGYDTDLVVRGDGGIGGEPTVDGIPFADFGVRVVPMRRMLRMLGLSTRN